MSTGTELVMLLRGRAPLAVAMTASAQPNKVLTPRTTVAEPASRPCACCAGPARRPRPWYSTTSTTLPVVVNSQSVSGGRLDTLSQQQDKLNVRLLSLGN